MRIGRILRLIVIGILFLLTEVIDGWCDEESARRYVMAYETRVYMLFSLLDRKEVQKELKLTKQQLEEIKRCWRGEDKELEIKLKHLCKKHKEEMGNPLLSEEEKVQLIEQFNKVLDNVIKKYQENRLRNILTLEQWQRLFQLYLQTIGPVAIFSIQEVAESLRLTDSQRKEMKKIISYYHPVLTFLRREFGLAQFNDISLGDTEEEREKTMEALITIIRFVEKRRDEELLGVLSLEQKRKWKCLIGEPLPIVWPPQVLAEKLFEE